MSDEQKRKKYDILFKNAESGFEIEDYQNEINKKKPSEPVIQPGDFKYPMDKNFINKSKDVPQIEKLTGDRLMTSYHLYEYMLGYLWEKEEKNIKFIKDDFSDNLSHPDLFLMVNKLN